MLPNALPTPHPPPPALPITFPPPPNLQSFNPLNQTTNRLHLYRSLSLPHPIHTLTSTGQTGISLSHPCKNIETPPFSFLKNPELEKLNGGKSYAEVLKGGLIKEKDDSKRTPRVNFPSNKSNKITTIYIGGLASNSSPLTLANAFRRFGKIQEISWRKERRYAFLKYDDHEQAVEAIHRMKGRMLLGSRIYVGLANTEMRVKHEFQNNNHDHRNTTKDFANDATLLTLNQESNERLELSALVIDRVAISTEKLLTVLKNRNVQVRKCCKWGMYGCIIECLNENSFKNLTIGPSFNEDGFLKIQPMIQRRACFSRIAWIELRGIPFEYCSMESAWAIAKQFGDFLYYAETSYELKQAGYLYVLIETTEPGIIQGFTKVYTEVTENNQARSFRIWVEEIRDEITNKQFEFGISQEEIESLNEDIIKSIQKPHESQVDQESHDTQDDQDLNDAFGVLDTQDAHRAQDPQNAHRTQDSQDAHRPQDFQETKEVGMAWGTEDAESGDEETENFKFKFKKNCQQEKATIDVDVFSSSPNVYSVTMVQEALRKELENKCVAKDVSTSHSNLMYKVQNEDKEGTETANNTSISIHTGNGASDIQSNCDLHGPPVIKEKMKSVVDFELEAHFQAKAQISPQKKKKIDLLCKDNLHNSSTVHEYQTITPTKISLIREEILGEKCLETECRSSCAMYKQNIQKFRENKEKEKQIIGLAIQKNEIKSQKRKKTKNKRDITLETLSYESSQPVTADKFSEEEIQPGRLLQKPIKVPGKLINGKKKNSELNKFGIFIKGLEEIDEALSSNLA